MKLVSWSECAGKTIKAVSQVGAHDIVLVLFTDDTYAGLGATDPGDAGYPTPDELTELSDAALYSYYSGPAMDVGLVTEEEVEAWRKKDMEEIKMSAIKNRRRQYEELKKEFDEEQKA